jgi:uncharacterized membrane protein
MFIKLYFSALAVFLGVDILWLTIIAKDFYAKQIGFLMKTNVNFLAAFLFYLLFIVGIVIFVITPSLKNSSWLHALLYGALFGLISYATYDLTNLATIKDWPLLVTVIDLIWGSFIGAFVSTLTYFIAKKFFS